MKSYGIGNEPSLSKPGDKKYYYKNATNYKAASVSGIGVNVNKCLKDMNSDIISFTRDINEKVEDLEKQFGKEFILVNNQELGFVDVDAFLELNKKLKANASDAVEVSGAFFDDVQNKIDAANDWLKELEDNYKNYNGAKVKLAQAVKTWGDVGSKAIDDAKAEVNQYKKLSGDPLDYGSWVTK